MMAGNASRMKINENKVYLPLKDKMVFEFSLNRFMKFFKEIICVIRPEDEKYLANYQNKVKIAYGGNTRQESVYNGLIMATGDYVLIHDAARPFITDKIINECINALNDGYSVLVGNESKDSIYCKNPLTALNRSNLFSAQTPQGSKLSIMLSCHEYAKKEGLSVTDDISLILKYTDEIVKLIEGCDENFKITTQLDYIIAKELVKKYD